MTQVTKEYLAELEQLYAEVPALTMVANLQIQQFLDASRAALPLLIERIRELEKFVWDDADNESRMRYLRQFVRSPHIAISKGRKTAMTKEEIRALSNRELDLEIAQYAPTSSEKRIHWPYTGGFELVDVIPAYSTDADEALRLLDEIFAKMKMPGLTIWLNRDFHGTLGWEISSENTTDRVYAVAITLPRAIAEAYLVWRQGK